MNASGNEKTASSETRNGESSAWVAKVALLFQSERPTRLSLTIRKTFRGRSPTYCFGVRDRGRVASRVGRDTRVEPARN
jgi:hypothetical protein